MAAYTRKSRRQRFRFLPRDPGHPGPFCLIVGTVFTGIVVENIAGRRLKGRSHTGVVLGAEHTGLIDGKRC